MSTRTKKKEQPLTMPQRIYEYMKARGVEVSKGEICKALEVNHEAVRKTLTRLANAGVLMAIPDDLDTGIVRYKLHEKAVVEIKNGKPAVVITNSKKSNPEPEVKPEPEPEVKKKASIKEMDDDPKDTLEQMYSMGYAKGYDDAMQAGHRDAYNAGRRTVIEGLLKLLKVDARVLMS